MKRAEDKRVYNREGDDWHFYSVKGNELILSDKERVESSHLNINSIKRLQKQNVR